MSGTIGIIAVGALLGVSLIVGLVGKRQKRDVSTFVLGGRALSPFVLFATMAATNFSAFTVFGLSGAGYRLGWSYFPVMAFGTGFVAFAFLLVGIPIRRMAAERSWTTQADFIRDRFGSPAFAKLVSAALLACTLPYIAAQIVSGGRLVAAWAGVPYPVASALVAFVTLAYVLAGGMRSVARTDVVQFFVLAGGALAAFAAVALNGGLQAAAARLAVLSPAHLARGGAGAGVSFGSYAGYVLLWFLANPMFPQLFQRFVAARDDRSVAFSALMYPLVTTALFFCTVGVGVVGAAVIPGLDAAKSEGIFMLMAEKAAGGIGVVFGLSALAALMSTLDSQILSVASMLDRDFAPGCGTGDGRTRILALAVTVAGWLVALKPPATILGLLQSTSFPGYAAIGVVFLLALFTKTRALPAVAAFSAGAALVILEAAGVVKAPGPHPVFFNTIVQLVAWAVSVPFAIPKTARTGQVAAGSASGTVARFPARLALGAAVALVAGLDFWSYGAPVSTFMGLPDWMWRYLALGAGLAIVVAVAANDAAKAANPSGAASDGNPVAQRRKA